MTKKKPSAPLHNRKPRIAVDTLPAFCDYSCTHAAFAPADAVGACRREQGVYCKELRRYVNKHAPCLVRSQIV